MPSRKPVTKKAKPSTKPKRQTKAAAEGIAPAQVKEKPEGYVFGRPTDYRPEFCEKVIEWGKLGKSKAWMAAELGVSKQSMYEWEGVHPDFSEALARAITLSQQWWEDAGQRGMEANLFNSAVWAKNMAARFRDEWTDRQELTGAAGASLIPVINVTTSGTA